MNIVQNLSVQGCHSDLLLVLLDELHIFLVLLHLFEAVEELRELLLEHLGQVHC